MRVISIHLILDKKAIKVYFQTSRAVPSRRRNDDYMRAFYLYSCPMHYALNPRVVCALWVTQLVPVRGGFSRQCSQKTALFKHVTFPSVRTVKVHATMCGAFAPQLPYRLPSTCRCSLLTQILAGAFTTSPACDKVLKRRGHAGDFGMRVRVIYRDTSTRKNYVFFQVITKAEKYKDVSAGLTTHLRTRLFREAIQSYCTVLLASARSIIDHSGCVLLHGVSNSVLVGQRTS